MRIWQARSQNNASLLLGPNCAAQAVRQSRAVLDYFVMVKMGKKVLFDVILYKPQFKLNILIKDKIVCVQQNLVKMILPVCITQPTTQVGAPT